MEIRPILSTLRRHRLAAALLALEIALTCAIVCNGGFLISERLRRIDRPTGLVESEILQIRMAGISKHTDAEAQTRADLEILRQLPGVNSVAHANQIPLGASSWNSGVRLTAEKTEPALTPATYLGSEALLETFGLQLIAGRDFLPDEYVDFEATQAADSKVTVPAIILSRATAESLFPGENALGKSLYSWSDEPMRVVGVVERLVRPKENWGSVGHSIIMPVRMPYEYGSYVLRVDPGQRSQILAQASRALEEENPSRIFLQKRSFDEARADYYRRDRAMAWLLGIVCLALVVVTALGIVGLASFWVQERTRQIGIRRALGATRGQIVRYFLTENFLVTSMGIAAGMAMAYGVNLWLMDHYELPRLPLAYFPVGAVVLWCLGQLAVLGPALRAALVPPATATRSV